MNVSHFFLLARILNQVTILLPMSRPSRRTGVDDKGFIRSLPLPNLSHVTRVMAKRYFDNSWTSFETLFAGLKGEEGFYRYVSLSISRFRLDGDVIKRELTEFLTETM